MRKRLIVAGLWLIIPSVGLIAALALYHKWEMRAIAPPAGVQDIDSFLQWRPETDSFLVVQPAAGPEHLMATGTSRSFASGPSAYVFDRSGRIVEWSFDIGDDPRFDRRWNAQRARTSAPRLSLAAAEDWLEADH